MVHKRRALGDKGEDLAVRHLKKRGYKVIERNYSCPYGEIDLMAREGDTLVFVEIKTRSSSDFGLPQDAVDHFKQQKLMQVAMAYMTGKQLPETIHTRFDVVAVRLNPDPETELIQDAFQAG